MSRGVASRGLVAWMLGLVFVGAIVTIADARPGGGHSYSGGSHSSSGGGSYSSGGGSYRSGGGSSYRSGGGGSDFSPGAAIGILLGLGIAVLIVVAIANSGSENTYTSTATAPLPPRKLELAPLLAADPDFSRVAFEDFVYQLYSAAQRSRHDRAGELTKLTPYIGAGAMGVLAQRASRVDHVVIGNLRVIEVGQETGGPNTKIVVAIEANLAGPGGTTNATERWTFVRAPGVKTRAPDRTRLTLCPNCNAPFQNGEGSRTCAHCNTTIDDGRFDWTLYSIVVDAETSVGYTLTGTVAEVGNDYPTVVEDDAQAKLMLLRHDDANVTWEAFAARVAMIYERLNTAWNAQDLTAARGLVTQSLLQYLEFWTREYKRQGLANRLDEARISHIQLAKVTRDQWFDAITVRVYADGIDYTLDSSQRVVGGSRDARRAYTEYWTFIRSSARRGPITTTPSCPNCGAPLAISNAGQCTHCKAEVESASFDWTLSKIEQDDVYRG